MGRRKECAKVLRPRITVGHRSAVRFSSGLVKQIKDILGFVPGRFNVEVYEDRIVFRPDENGNIRTWKDEKYDRRNGLYLWTGSKLIDYAITIGCTFRTVKVNGDGSVVWYSWLVYEDDE